MEVCEHWTVEIDFFNYFILYFLTKNIFNIFAIVETHPMDDEDETTPPPSPALQIATDGNAAQPLSSCYDGNLTFPRQPHMHNAYGHSMGGSSSVRRHDLPALITEGEGMMYRMPGENEGASCSESHLSEIMPDVAMATASLGHLQLNEPPESLQLDLGDGSSHGMMGAGAIGAHGIQVNFQFLMLKIKQ